MAKDFPTSDTLGTSFDASVGPAAVPVTIKGATKAERIITLARDGFSTAEIARMTGSTAGSVGVICSRARSEGADIPVLRGRAQRGREFLMVPVKQDMIAQLQDECDRRGIKDPGALVALLLQAVLRSDAGLDAHL